MCDWHPHTPPSVYPATPPPHQAPHSQMHYCGCTQVPGVVFFRLPSSSPECAGATSHIPLFSVGLLTAHPAPCAPRAPRSAVAGDSLPQPCMLGGYVGKTCALCRITVAIRALPVTIGAGRYVYGGGDCAGLRPNFISIQGRSHDNCSYSYPTAPGGVSKIHLTSYSRCWSLPHLAIAPSRARSAGKRKSTLAVLTPRRKSGIWSYFGYDSRCGIPILPLETPEQ